MVDFLFSLESEWGSMYTPLAANKRLGQWPYSHERPSPHCMVIHHRNQSGDFDFPGATDGLYIYIWWLLNELLKCLIMLHQVKILLGDSSLQIAFSPQFRY